MFFTKTFIAAGGLAALSQAHITMNSPKPYTVPAVISSPINADGSNFPCQAVGDITYEGVPTEMAKGSSQSMSFTGSAVHGGGSCQVSLTYDAKPSKNSAFKVIHSFQGGCPARAPPPDGNFPADPNFQGTDKYEFKIPDDVPTGNATLAWSWFNKIGNREFYMNCAPISITGSEGTEAALAALPDMLVGNIGNGCSTESLAAGGFSVQYPNPGSAVDTADVPLKAPDGCGGGAAAAAASPAPAVRGRRAVLRA
jgi:hypothetical protein